MAKINFYEIFTKAVGRSFLTAAMEAVKFCSIPLELVKQRQEEEAAEVKAAEEITEKTERDFNLKYKALALDAPLSLQMRSLTNNFRKMHGQPLRRQRYGGPRRQRRHK